MVCVDHEWQEEVVEEEVSSIKHDLLSINLSESMYCLFVTLIAFINFMILYPQHGENTFCKIVFCCGIIFYKLIDIIIGCITSRATSVE